VQATISITSQPMEREFHGVTFQMRKLRSPACSDFVHGSRCDEV
jgi:hypothetical protein